MNNSWGYNSEETSYKTPSMLIMEMVKVVSRDGNYFLNIGPRGDGSIPPQSIDFLDSIGNWMNIYGESIYGTTRSPYMVKPKWGFYTKKYGILFFHVFNWPKNSLLQIPSLTNHIEKIYLRNDLNLQLKYSYNNNWVTIFIPENPPNETNSVIVVDVSRCHRLASNCKKDVVIIQFISHLSIN